MTGSPAPTAGAAAAADQVVARRLVLFVHGFDPRGVAMPYSNFLREFEKHKKLTGGKGAVSAIEPPPPGKPWLKRWRVELSEPGEPPVETVVDFLEWQDLIPRRRPFRFFRLSFAAILTFFVMLRRGIHLKMGRYARSHGALGIFPFATLAIYLWIMASLVWAGFAIGRPYGTLAAAAGVAIGAALAAGFYRWTVYLDRYLFVWFALALWHLQWRHGGRGYPALAARFAAFADHALDRLRDKSFDDVVVVAVSTAGYYAIEMLGRMIERDPRLGGRRVAFLTLGGQPSITSWFGPRRSFVEAISAVLRSDAVTWIAYTIRGDIMTVAEYDPFRDLGLDRTAFPRGGIVHHRIHIKRMLTPERVRALGWNFLWLHLHYLMASETGEEHDFFALTCGSSPTLHAAAAWRARALAARNPAAGQRAPGATAPAPASASAAAADGDAGLSA
jgi:hypothetical protein